MAYVPKTNRQNSFTNRDKELDLPLSELLKLSEAQLTEHAELLRDLHCSETFKEAIERVLYINSLSREQVAKLVSDKTVLYTSVLEGQKVVAQYIELLHKQLMISKQRIQISETQTQTQ